MKFTSLIAVATILSLVAVPAMAEMSEYQKGVNDGLVSGLRIGYLLGGAPYDTSAAQQYSSMVNPFNAWLQKVFGANQTEINLFWMKPQAGQAMVGGYQAYPTVNSTKPVHSIGGSWNQSTTAYHPDAKGKIYGYDPDTYYTMVGSAYQPAAPKDANGNYISGSLQAP
jgi:hypothetical protein